MLMVARGSMQRHWEQSMYLGVMSSPARQIHGSAARWMPRYWDSWRSLCYRLEQVGRHVMRRPGDHGGEWGAQYTTCSDEGLHKILNADGYVCMNLYCAWEHRDEY